MRATYDAAVAPTDAFCRDHLDDDYRELARDMAAALCRKRPSPLASGRPRTWACGIAYALGQVNFLSDRSTRPHMAMADVCAGFGVGQSTASAKARAISDALGIHPLDPRWSVPSLLGRNPLVWMAEVNGMLVDLRHMPREVQEIAFGRGMIPYIPADRKWVLPHFPCCGSSFRGGMGTWGKPHFPPKCRSCPSASCRSSRQGCWSSRSCPRPTA